MSVLLVVGLVVVALVIGGGVGYLATRTSNASASGQRGRRQTTSTAGTSSSTTSGGAGATLRVAGVTPPSGSTRVNPTAPIVVTFSAPLAADSPKPRLNPSTPGSWSVRGDEMVFTPSVPYLPLTPVTLRVPSGSSGVRGKDGSTLAKGAVDHFRTENGSILRLQQLLSELDYSPLSWQPSGSPIAPGDEAAQVAALVRAPSGSFTWRNKGWPAELTDKWKPGVDDLFTKGLVMSFEADHGLIPTGTIDRALWVSLVTAVANHSVNTGGYNYALANKAQPESLTVWHDGHVAVKTPVNTGIASSPTPDGTFAVYSRLRQQVMKGTNPDGSHYADLVQYVAYFHGNDAVHYMPRAGYGIPQSLGCIELPLAQAAQVWPYLAYGTLVTVIN